MQLFYRVCLILLIAGGVNWGLNGLFSFDLIGWLFGGSATVLARAAYIAIGAAAVCAIPGLFSDGGEG